MKFLLILFTIFSFSMADCPSSSWGSTTKCKISIHDANITEGDSGEKYLELNISSDDTTNKDIKIDFNTEDDSATASEDYNDTTLTATIPDGKDYVIVKVPIIGDTKVEGDEIFKGKIAVNSDSDGDAEIDDGEADAKIIDDDDIDVTIDDYSGSEGDDTHTIKITINLSKASNNDIKLDIKSEDDSATEGEDYKKIDDTITIPAGDTSKEVEITIYGDEDKEDDEDFKVKITINEADDNVKITKDTSTLTLKNDDDQKAKVTNLYHLFDAYDRDRSDKNGNDNGYVKVEDDDDDTKKEDRNITTKIVYDKKDDKDKINLTIGGFDSDNDDTKLKEWDLNVSVGILRCKNANGTWLDGNCSKLPIIEDDEYNESIITTDSLEKDIELNTTRAVKIGATYLGVCSLKSGDEYKVYDIQQCDKDCSDDDDSDKCIRYITSTDKFSIRPYGFRIFIDGDKYGSAGDDFNVTVIATDRYWYSATDGKVGDVYPVKDYNETLSNLRLYHFTYQGTDDEVKQMNKDMYGEEVVNRDRVAYCPHQGIFRYRVKSFSDGKIDPLEFNYSEAGAMSMVLLEKIGSEFARVDKDDTTVSLRTIADSSKDDTRYLTKKDDLSKNDLIGLVIPYYIVVTNGEFKRGKDYNWTYMADFNLTGNATNKPQSIGIYFGKTDDDNFTIIDKNSVIPSYRLKITALNKQREVTRNFTKTCFPDYTSDAPKKGGVNGIKLNVTFDISLKKLSITADKDVSTIFTLLNDFNKSNCDTCCNFEADGNYTDGKESAYDLIYKKVDLEAGKETDIKPTDHLMSCMFRDGIYSPYIKAYIPKRNEKLGSDYDIPVNPVNLNVGVVDIDLSWGPPPYLEDGDFDENMSYRYGYFKLKESDMGVYGHDLNDSVQYLYYVDDDWNKSVGHIAEVGDINLSKSIYDGLEVTLSDIINQEENISIHRDSVPYSKMIHLDIPDYLWYDIIAKPYKSPADNSRNCREHPCIKVKFETLQRRGSWLGIETEKGVSETNNSVNVDVKDKKEGERTGFNKVFW